MGTNIAQLPCDLTVRSSDLQSAPDAAGRHLILDLWGGEGLTDIKQIETTMRRAVEAAGATLLHIHLHHFTPNFGVSGVAVLAESHISIHTWPELEYSAIDIFMCGDTDPHKAVEIMEQAFKPDRSKLVEIPRGAAAPSGSASG